MGFFGDLFSAAGSLLGIAIPGAGGVIGAAFGNGLGKIIGGEEDRSRADAAAQQQAEYNQQYLDYLNKTNEQNYAMWRDQNIWNRDMMREANRFQFNLQQNQQDYNTQMWHMNNAYNDPSAQRERWENAGFSPWTMAGGAGGGLVSSSAPTSGQGSAHQAQGAQPLPMQAMQQLVSPKMIGLQALRELVDSGASAQKAMNDSLRLPSDVALANSQSALNAANASKAAQDVRRGKELLPYEKRIAAADANMKETDVDFTNATYMERKRSIELGNSIQAAQVAGLLLSNKAKSIENRYLDGISQARISLMAAEAFQAVENGNLSIARAKESVAHAFLMSAQAKGQLYDNKMKEELANIAKEYTNELFLSMALANDKLYVDGELTDVEHRYRSRYGFGESILNPVRDLDYWRTDIGFLKYDRSWRRNYNK